MEGHRSGTDLEQGAAFQPPAVTRNAPRRYMSKSQRACDLCRSRKSACRVDKVGSRCRLCSSLGRQCTFDSGPVPRSVRNSNKMDHQHQAGAGGVESTGSEGTIDTSLTHSMDLDGGIETSLLAVQHSNNTHLDFGSLEDWTTSTDQLFAEPLLFSQEMLMPAGLDTQGRTTNAVLEPYPDFDISPSLSLRDSSSERELIFPESVSLDSIPEHVNMQVMGPTGDQDPHLIKYHRFNSQNVFTYNRISYRTVVDRESSVQFELTRSDHSSAKADQNSNATALIDERNKLEKLIPPDAGVRLIQLFYKFVNHQFPILSPIEIPTPIDCPTHLLAAIYLISEQFTDFDEYLCIQIVYKSTPLKDLFDIAWRIICNSMDRPTIPTIQACLILLLKAPIDPITLERPFKWSLLGSLIHMAQTLGLHLSPDSWRVPYQEIQLRTRLSWLLFTMDKWFAFSFGRPSNLSRDNWTITDIYNRTLGNSNTAEGTENLYHIQFSKLTNILDDALRSLFSIRALETLRTDYRRTLSIARPLLAELSTWHKELPSSVQFEDSAHEASVFDNPASLELGYHSLQLAILRAILHSFRSDLSALQDRETLEWKEANIQCRAAAKNAVISAHNFTSSLSTKHFQPFWAPWTRTGFSMTCPLCIVLIVTSRDPIEAAGYKLILDKARRALRMQSRSFEMIRFALLKMDAIFWVGFDKVFTSDLEMGGSF